MPAGPGSASVCDKHPDPISASAHRLDSDSIRETLRQLPANTNARAGPLELAGL